MALWLFDVEGEVAAASERARFSVDLPRSGATVYGDQLEVCGWAFGMEDAVTAVEVEVSGDGAARARPAQRRDDVAGAYPEVPAAGSSGFMVLAGVPRVARAEVVVSVVLGAERVPAATIHLAGRARDRWSGPDAPLVSVVIPCYNQGRFLGEAIASVHGQTYPRVELIVVDDGSSDDTSPVAAASGARCIRQDNQGPSAARNRGAAAARGEYVVFLDADDRLLPHGLEANVDAFAERPDAALVAGWFRYLMPAGEPLPHPGTLVENKHHELIGLTPPLRLDGDPYRALLENSYWITCPASAMYRREAFLAAGGFDDSYPFAEDLDLNVRLAREHPMFAHSVPIAEYRRHPGTRTTHSALLLESTVAALRAQSKRDRSSRAASRRGVARFRDIYGEPLARDLESAVRGRDWRTAGRAAWVLARRHPRGLAHAFGVPRQPAGEERGGARRQPVERLRAYPRTGRCAYPRTVRVLAGQTRNETHASRTELVGRLTRLETMASTQLAQLERLTGAAEAVSSARDNIPSPLRNPPSPLFSDTAHLMSFGERAALEGLLAELKPRLAIEIGTHEGGSLRRLAAHSRHVDSFDLFDQVPQKRSFGNVRFFIGDSKARLPPVLARYADRGLTVDFVLIDGDHTPEGVRADLTNVLASPACARTVIVLHDTMNAEVRSGIESAGLAEHPRVVYVELDFVAGYEFLSGSWRGQRWGGLGLVVTGDRTTDGYGDRPIQTRYVPTVDIFKPDGHAPAQATGAPQGQGDEALEWLRALEARAADQARALAAIEARLNVFASSAATASSPAPADPDAVLAQTHVTPRADSHAGPPLLTVIISTYNQERYVGDAIASVFAQQTRFPIQLIVTDDASTDSTLEVIESFRARRPELVTVIRSDRNGWYFANVLRALALTNTDYFTLLDADDYWTDETYLERGVDFLESHPEFVIYSANCLCEHADGSRMLFIRGDVPDQEFSFEDYLQNRALATQTTATMFRNVLFKTGVPKVFVDMLRGEEQYSFACDFDRYAIHLEKGRARLENSAVGMYRITGSGVYTGLSQLQKCLWEARRKLHHWRYFGYRHPEFFLDEALSWIDRGLEGMRHLASGSYADTNVTPRQVADVRRVVEECRAHIASLSQARRP